ncbi:MAG: bifunctional UDP-N-acetylglucosamine diphosphorylase/glucosamine-1-phosphate N-acetyltransferase GlmU [Coriobacteriales bacterium]|jgi:bifunctional UDP-N-acetylglucosamine pyrophosphorylase/glucosamine-1-phosphate N-acetyltransferase|nr:bifunctional UDP-N-acetylglucosamine diphosphorylase/glucosamine-1-phosphate N-acetyltransferase GlmU [Coriobacteriales bacterium]
MSFATLVLAAGAGTRMKSDLPKVAHELLGKPLIRWVVDAARTAGSTQTIVVVGMGREQVTALLDDVQLAVQDEQRGTGHAVAAARETLASLPATSSLVVLGGDTPLVSPSTIAALVKKREEHDAACCVLGFVAANPQGYGRLIRSVDGNLQAIVEEKDASAAERTITEVNGGAYCFRPDALLSVLSALSANNAQGEYYLTDAVGILAGRGERVSLQILNDPDELFGINDRVQLAEAVALARRRINRAHMLAGVTMHDPTSVWIGPDVVLQRDVEILPTTSIYGDSFVGSGSVIGPNSRLINVRVGANCLVDESIVTDCVLEDRVSVGPRAYLRPGTVMRQGSKAGTHVEIKRSEIGANSKVPHLSYIGDAVLGSDVNIGAGSITCNFDGAGKNPTRIGDRSFIGSDTMFVAPVTIGSDATTGAGSVITADVPDGALALERAKQVVISDWARRKMTQIATKWRQ